MSILYPYALTLRKHAGNSNHDNLMNPIIVRPLHLNTPLPEDKQTDIQSPSWRTVFDNISRSHPWSDVIDVIAMVFVLTDLGSVSVSAFEAGRYSIV